MGSFSLIHLLVYATILGLPVIIGLIGFVAFKASRARK